MSLTSFQGGRGERERLKKRKSKKGNEINPIEYNFDVRKDTILSLHLLLSLKDTAKNRTQYSELKKV